MKISLIGLLRKGACRDGVRWYIKRVWWRKLMRCRFFLSQASHAAWDDVWKKEMAQKHPYWYRWCYYVLCDDKFNDYIGHTHYISLGWKSNPRWTWEEAEALVKQDEETENTLLWQYAQSHLR